MKFVFIAKHRTIWPVAWLCNALGVSRSGFHSWLNRSPSARSRSDEAVGHQVRASFLASDRTYGARRVWRDLLADGFACGLHRIERLMRLQALRARARKAAAPRRLINAFDRLERRRNFEFPQFQLPGQTSCTPPRRSQRPLPRRWTRLRGRRLRGSSLRSGGPAGKF